jgi:cysteinyl-tRNA synthetase
MSHELLGGSFDIHGGGIDLQFPHHENEIAQSRCAHPEEGFAKVWMHNEMLLVEGKKMSKSLGNFFTVRDLLDQGVPGEVIRFVLLGTHYSKPMDWRKQKALLAQETLDTWASKLMLDPAVFLGPLPAIAPDKDVLAALADDLNTSLALTRLAAMGKFINNSEAFLALPESEQVLSMQQLVVSAALVGFDMKQVVTDFRERQEKPPLLEEISMKLAYARAQRDWQTADAIRSSVEAAGVRVMIGKDGKIEFEKTGEFDEKRLEAFR